MGVSRLGAPVQFRGISKHYGSFCAIHGLQLDIRAGEFMTLLGPSGSGKTTTLMLIAGFDAPSAGEILIDGAPVVRLPPYRRNVGMVFQSYALFPHMTVAENIGFPLKQRGVVRAERDAAVRRMLDLVQLPGFAGRYPQQLSGGQQQRVAIARAVVFDPQVLLMDEPLSALDKQLRDAMQMEIKRLHDRLGITFVYVTHDQGEALAMSDRVAVMNEGRVEQLASPQAVYDAPSNRFVAAFVGQANFAPVSSVAEQDDGLLVWTAWGAAVRAPQQPHASGCACMVRPERMTAGPPGGAPPGGRGGAGGRGGGGPLRGGARCGAAWKPPRRICLRKRPGPSRRPPYPTRTLFRPCSAWLSPSVRPRFCSPPMPTTPCWPSPATCLMCWPRH